MHGFQTLDISCREHIIATQKWVLEVPQGSGIS
jgi:hypothetical protein